jgi:hypothetical protein
MALITLQQAKDHLKITTPPGDVEDPDLILKIAVAEELVRDYVAQRRDDPADAWASTVAAWDVDADPPVLPPFRVQAAVLLQLGDLWRYRGDDLATDQPTRASGELAQGVTALLYRLRDPAVA